MRIDIHLDNDSWRMPFRAQNQAAFAGGQNGVTRRQAQTIRGLANPQQKYAGPR